MIIDDETAESLKLTAAKIFSTPEGEEFIEYLEMACRVYDAGNLSTMAVNTGRIELLDIIKNLNKLSAEQIVEYHRQ